jgi:ABC-type multidrug transport system fused ATPase/permease subunit
LSSKYKFKKPKLIIYYYFDYKRYYVTSTRQIKRLEAISKSPIFSHFGETLNGISTIRAFGAQKRFIEQMENKIDENLIFFYPNNVVLRYILISSYKEYVLAISN